MCAARFLPIDVDRHSDLCVQFLCDAFICSYGNTDHLATLGGAEGYIRGLRDAVSDFPGGAVHVWREDNIVGQVELHVRDDEGIGFANLFYLVSPERGTGLASELHRYAIDVFRRHGLATARLSVSPRNTRALRYYVKHGWRDLGPRPDRPYVHAMDFDLSEPST